VCDVCDGRGKVISEETLALRAERLIKREAAATDMQALLIGLNPYVAGELSQDSSSAIKELEEQTMRDIFIKADATLGRDDVKVIAAGSLEEILALVHPVKKGETIEVHVGQPNQDRPDQGIAVYKGLPIHIEDGAALVGKTLKVKISRVFKGYAKARVEGRHETRIEHRREEPEEDGIILEVREPRRQQNGPVAVTPAPVKVELPEADDIVETEADLGDAVPGQEAKKKRRRRRHRKNAKERAAMQAGLEAEAQAKADDMPAVATDKPKPLADTDIDESKPEVAALPAEESGAEPSAMTASKKRRRRRHRSRKAAQSAEGTSLAGNDEVMGEAAAIKAMTSAIPPTAAIHAAQRPIAAQSQMTGEAENGKTEAVTIPVAAEGPRKASSQQSRRPRTGSRGPAKKAEKPADATGTKVEAPAPVAAKAEAAGVTTQQKPAEGLAEAKPKRQYNRRKKAPDAAGKANSAVDTQAE
jgi:predicted RNA-binding protein with TRAM domain